MTLAYVLAGVVLLALTAYALLGGADFGGGVWDLLALGPRKEQQRELIAHAIGPVWEANHVWLILGVVLLFTCFPLAFLLLAQLHIPLTLALVGIVLRGSAFSFRAYGDSRAAGVRRWGRVFSIASLITPLFLGMCVGAVTSGFPAWDAASPNTFRAMYVTNWLNSYCISVGVLTLAAFAFLAAVYLTAESTDSDLREDFRLKGLWAGIAVGLAALLVLVLAGSGAPAMREGLLHSSSSIPLLTLAVATIAIAALWTRRWRLARVAAAAEVALLLWGWGLGQFPYLIPPDLTIESAAAPQATLEAVTIALVVGGAVLIPSLVYLFRVFKSARATELP